MTMTKGKHLLLDCYGCRKESISHFAPIHQALEKAIDITAMPIDDTHVHQSDDAMVISAIGIGNQICIHVYPQWRYLAIDVFTFDTAIDPTVLMKIFRQAFHPDKIRATSIKRGKIDSVQDMKPQTRSQTTAMRKMKTTGRQIKKTSGKMWNAIRKKKQK